MIIKNDFDLFILDNIKIKDKDINIEIIISFDMIEGYQDEAGDTEETEK